MTEIENIIQSRKIFLQEPVFATSKLTAEAEGGCGVVGLVSSTPIYGKHFLRSLIQMHNRGNGKGGGIAIFGLSAAQLGVSQQILDSAYILQVAYIDPLSIPLVEHEFINPHFIIHYQTNVETVPDYTSIGLEVNPPAVRRYFVNVQKDALQQFMTRSGIRNPGKAEDEYIYQNTYLLNKKFYSSLGEKRAFVLSHGKNMLIFKLVGYAEEVIKYYKLEQMSGYVWIGHHRYPTKGIVWHPGGAHPFLGLNDALVHNGDFSNYHAVSEYLAQFNIFPLFLTDTEVAAYLFDLYGRVFEYPTEYIIEALAPTTERDFCMLDKFRQRIYREIQLSHINGSPDGPWFFIIGRSQTEKKHLQLLGITDTSMLRPQVFALHEADNGERIALVASERQAIDAILSSIAADFPEFASKAVHYWVARGGSYTDGGAFIFDLDYSNGKPVLVVYDKFGKVIDVPKNHTSWQEFIAALLPAISESTKKHTLPYLREFSSLQLFCISIEKAVGSGALSKISAVEALTDILDHLHLTPLGRSGRTRAQLEKILFTIFRTFTPLKESHGLQECVYISVASRTELRRPEGSEKILIMDAVGFPTEGAESAALFIVAAYKLGWKHIYSFDWAGQRFAGCGLGPNSAGFRLDLYGTPGDYLGSGNDGAAIYVHASAQDQVAQLMKSGRLVIYGDVGQAFLYGAKGGSIYVLGNAAGRPLINAVGRPRVVINGTCLDYLAESFMAGDPFNDGGFIILGGIAFDAKGTPYDLDTPYPGGNLFSLASGGALYVRDPKGMVGTDQLHGGKFSSFTIDDSKLILPYIHENEQFFKISLLESNNFLSGTKDNNLDNLFRKIVPAPLHI